MRPSRGDTRECEGTRGKTKGHEGARGKMKGHEGARGNTKGHEGPRGTTRGYEGTRRVTRGHEGARGGTRGFPILGMWLGLPGITKTPPIVCRVDTREFFTRRRVVATRCHCDGHQRNNETIFACPCPFRVILRVIDFVHPEKMSALYAANAKSGC